MKFSNRMIIYNFFYLIICLKNIFIYFIQDEKVDIKNKRKKMQMYMHIVLESYLLLNSIIFVDLNSCMKKYKNFCIRTFIDHH